MSIGPSMPLRLEKPEGIDLAQAARYFGQTTPGIQIIRSFGAI